MLVSFSENLWAEFSEDVGELSEKLWQDIREKTDKASEIDLNILRVLSKSDIENILSPRLFGKYFGKLF